MENKLAALLFGASLLFSAFVLPTFFEQKSTDALAQSLCSRTDIQMKTMIGNSAETVRIIGISNSYLKPFLSVVKDTFLCEKNAMITAISRIGQQKQRTSEMYSNLYHQKQGCIKGVYRRDGGNDGDLEKQLQYAHTLDIRIDTTLAKSPIDAQNMSLQSLQLDLNVTTLFLLHYYMSKFSGRMGDVPRKRFQKNSFLSTRQHQFIAYSFLLLVEYSRA